MKKYTKPEVVVKEFFSEIWMAISGVEPGDSIFERGDNFFEDLN